MRLIDAEKIDFSEVFEGQSDFAKDIREAAQGLINKQPTAFNEEKVIAEMKKRGTRVCASAACMEDCGNCEHGILMRDLINIVKEGGN